MPVFFASNIFTVHATAEEWVPTIETILHIVGQKNLELVPRLIVDIDMGPYCEEEQVGQDWYFTWSRVVRSAITSITHTVEEDEGGIASRLRICKDASFKMRFSVSDSRPERHAIVIHLHDSTGSLINGARQLRTTGLRSDDMRKDMLESVAGILDLAKEKAQCAK